MIALVETNLPTEPSRLVVRAGKAAATSPHAVVNLTRLVKALGEEADGPSEDPIALRKEWETVQYARVLLGSLRTTNEQSSSDARTLDALETTLSRIQQAFPTAMTSPGAHAHSEPFSYSPSLQATTRATTAASRAIPSQSAEMIPLPSSPAPPPIATDKQSAPASFSSSSALRQRRAPDSTITDYLRKRQAEDAAGDEAGLLPLKVQDPARKSTGQGARDALLDGARATMGSKALHEELGGQLADMSHRLKLNAMHFASSLEEEKALLETSQDVLEKNLESTRSSKKNLSAVSKRGRGTTCMTLGVVLLVIVLFVWTYMLIRFT